MPIFKELALAVPALALYLLVSDALFGPAQDAHAGRSTAVSGVWIGADSLPAERWLAKDSFVTGGSGVAAGRPVDPRRFEPGVTPHARIRGVFAQFVPGESGRAIF